MYYQEFQLFSNSIDLANHINIRKGIYQRLKDLIEGQRLRKSFQGQAFHNQPLISSEEVFEFLKSEKINEEFLTDLKQHSGNL